MLPTFHTFPSPFSQLFDSSGLKVLHYTFMEFGSIPLTFIPQVLILVRVLLFSPACPGTPDPLASSPKCCWNYAYVPQCQLFFSSPFILSFLHLYVQCIPAYTLFVPPPPHTSPQPPIPEQNLFCPFLQFC
jgi:hypothetical protein